MKKVILIATIAFLVFSLFSLEFLSGVAKAGEGKPGWQLAWEKTLQEAKKEGQVVYYGSDTVETLMREFEKKYQIKAIAAAPAGGGRFATERLPAERRANKYLADLYIFSPSSGLDLHRAKVFDPLKPALILPEVLDQSKWWQGKHHYVDPEDQYILAFEGIMRVDITYNTNLVDPNELKSFWDLLNPQWKSKIVGFDHMVGLGSNSLRFLYYNQELGPEFLKRLYGEMGVTISRDPRQIMDWLAQGKFAFAILTAPAVLEAHVAKAQGLPVNWFHPKDFKEGAALTSSASTVALINRAPHPNAAKVAINWLLSREGQLAYQRILDPGHDSLRIDIPKDVVPADLRRIEGVKYLNVDRYEWLDMTVIREFVNKVLADTKK